MKISLHHRLPVALFVVFSFVNSCKNDGCNNPVAFNYDSEGTQEEPCIFEPKQVFLNVSPKFGSEDLLLNTAYTTSDDRKFLLTYYGMYISNLSFTEKGFGEARNWSNRDVMLLRDAENTLTSVYLNRSEIFALSFDIGIDTAIYDQDPTTSDRIDDKSPLAIQTPSMYWGWASGYRFISVEGMVDTSAANDGSQMAPFGFHCGLPANLKTITIPFEHESSSSQNINLELEFDFEVLFEDVDFGDLIIHDGTHPTTVKIMENSIRAFEII